MLTVAGPVGSAVVADSGGAGGGAQRDRRRRLLRHTRHACVSTLFSFRQSRRACASMLFSLSYFIFYPLYYRFREIQAALPG